jgi:Domain of unknown function (DUF4386)
MPRNGSGDRLIRRAGAVAGFALLVVTVLSVFAFIVVIKGLIVHGDAAKTASNILDSETRFRIAVACFALVAVFDVIVAWALRVFFAPVSELVSNLAAAVRVAYAAVFLVATAHLIVVSQLLMGNETRAGFTASELTAQGLLQIDTFTAVWNAGLVLFGFDLLLLAYLAIRSSYVPTWLGILLVLSGCGYLIDSFGLIFVRDYSASVSDFTFIGEALFMLWLLARSRHVRLGDESRPPAAVG